MGASTSDFVLLALMQATATLVPNTAAAVPQSVTMQIYRSQNLSWVNDITNSDVADAAGSSCYIESATPEDVYPVAVIASYTITAAAIDNAPITNSSGYANCPDVHIGSPTRTCHDGNKLKVGATNCTYPGRLGLWYSLPKAGMCGAGGRIGVDCYWRLESHDKTVLYTCMRKEGCAQGLRGCPPEALQRAFAACPGAEAATREDVRSE